MIAPSTRCPFPHPAQCTWSDSFGHFGLSQVNLKKNSFVGNHKMMSNNNSNQHSWQHSYVYSSILKKKKALTSHYSLTCLLAFKPREVDSCLPGMQSYWGLPMVSIIKTNWLFWMVAVLWSSLCANHVHLFKVEPPSSQVWSFCFCQSCANWYFAYGMVILQTVFYLSCFLFHRNLWSMSKFRTSVTSPRINAYILHLDSFCYIFRNLKKLL